MSPAAKDVFIILFDVNTKSKLKAHSTLSRILYLKELSESKDLTKLYLFNTDQTNNKQQFEGIVHLDLQELQTSAILEDISGYKVGKSNWLEALRIGVDALKECSSTPGLVTLQLLLITDFSSAPDDKLEVSNKIVREINEYDIFLYIVGPEYLPLKTLLSKKDVISWKNQLDDSNLVVATKLIKETKNSVMCDFKCGVHLFNSFKYQKGMQPRVVPLTIGSCLELPASTVRITEEEPPFRLNSENKKVFGNMKWVYEDDEQTTVEAENTVGGIIRHGKFVRIETDDMFKANEQRSFSILGFTNRENVPEYLFQGKASYLVMPDISQDEQYTDLFSLLVELLASSNMCAIGRRVYSAASNPMFVALIPKTDVNIKCFVMFELPYAEDITLNYNEKDLSSAKLVEKDDEIYKFLDSIDVSKENASVDAPLGPSMMIDPSCIDIIEKLEEKVLAKMPNFVKTELTSSDSQVFDSLLSYWPKREADTIKNEETEVLDDFDEFGNASFDD